MNELFSISIIIPTYNSENYLNKCLFSIFQQEYPKELIEILIIDGGSTDITLEIAKNYTDKIFYNPLKTGEAGKAIGVKNAKNELIALIDSDNVLPNKNWIMEMIKPLQEDNQIIGSEPLKYIYRKFDSLITRYCALTGMNDILCLFIGNYDRYCFLTDKWTEMNVLFENKKNYIDINFSYDKINQIPTIGANGTIFRRSFFEDINIGDYLFDIDLIALKIFYSKASVHFAKVENGIIHLFSGSILTYMKKQKRRVRDYKKYKKLRKYEWLKINNRGIIKFILYTWLTIPLILQAIKGYLKKRDVAWFFHPVACYITLFIYGFNFVNIKRK